MSQTLSVYYEHYVGLVNDQEMFEALQKEHENTLELMRAIPADKLHYRYDEGKWTPLELWQHVIDAERVFAYRALRFARADEIELPGYDHDNWVKECLDLNRDIDSLIEEAKVVRASTISLFRSFEGKKMDRWGKANGQDFQVKDLAYIIAGHEKHHNNVIRERYLD